MYLDIAIRSCHIGTSFHLLPPRSHNLFGRKFEASPSVDMLKIIVWEIGEKNLERCLFRWGQSVGIGVLWPQQNVVVP